MAKYPTIIEAGDSLYIKDFGVGSILSINERDVVISFHSGVTKEFLRTELFNKSIPEEILLTIKYNLCGFKQGERVFDCYYGYGTVVGLLNDCVFRSTFSTDYNLLRVNFDNHDNTVDYYAINASTKARASIPTLYHADKNYTVRFGDTVTYMKDDGNWYNGVYSHPHKKEYPDKPTRFVAVMTNGDTSFDIKKRL